MSLFLRYTRFAFKTDPFAHIRAGFCAHRTVPLQRISQHNQLHTAGKPSLLVAVHQQLSALHNHHPVRGKSKKSGKQTARAADDDLEDEPEQGDDADEYEELLGDKHNRTVRVTVNSMRADLLLKAGLGIARNKVEALFYDSKIRVNGKRLLKKSAQLEVEDEIDVVRGPSPSNPDHLIVSRVEIVSVTPRTENLSVTLRRHKSLIIENYKDHGAYSEGQDK
ncbi:mitochondrial transcription rescue factor 1 [Anopheles maculipalpis]|uniref:mitochondrial transcription rescue factor 1 n=1 Tax=Anopheles maculipalpis TaxID=1496333 RepID=UPI0021598D5C|nr:mitochondrial transcription rescue factor 1 [Anopheles maculipalpis]